MDGRPEQKLGCVGESEAEAQTARVGAADGAGNTVSGNWEREKRLFILQPHNNYLSESLKISLQGTFTTDAGAFLKSSSSIS